MSLFLSFLNSRGPVCRWAGELSSGWTGCRCCPCYVLLERAAPERSGINAHLLPEPWPCRSPPATAEAVPALVSPLQQALRTAPRNGESFRSLSWRRCCWASLLPAAGLQERPRPVEVVRQPGNCSCPSLGDLSRCADPRIGAAPAPLTSVSGPADIHQG